MPIYRNFQSNGANWPRLKLLQEGGSTPVLPTLPVIRVDLLHTEQIVQRHLSSTVFTPEGIQNARAFCVAFYSIFDLAKIYL